LNILKTLIVNKLETHKKNISVLTACYNEEENVAALIDAVSKIFYELPQYTYEHIFIDNCSTDKTVDILREISKTNKNVKVIVNARNFGHVRSPVHALKQCFGDAVIFLVADFQDPPQMIKTFLEKWENGNKLVLGIKAQSKENPIMFALRRTFYNILSKASGDDAPLKNFTGFGLYDKTFIDVVRQIDDPYPYFRGFVSEFGYDICKVEYTQPLRTAGKSKNNFFTLYDLAMLGFTNHSKLPLRLSAFIGFFSAIISLLVAIGYFVYKLMYWDTFQAGTAPMVIGVFFFSSVQLFFIGIIGEYIGAIHTQVRKRPLVIEKERINF
jgi:glycosyltransferase involved in cell wall biosynthesis